MVELQVPRPAAGPNGSFTLTLSSRPEFSWAVGPPKEMKNGSHAATALMQQRLSMGALPSTLSSRAKPRDLRFSGPFVEMFFDRADPGPVQGHVCGFP